MEILVADERALLLKEKLSLEQAEGRAWSNKLDAFGRVAKVTSFMRRPGDDDFELVYKEHRYEPFWHVVCSARYVYERRREYPLTLGGPEVERVTLAGQDYEVENGRLTLKGTEHCHEDLHEERFIDGISGELDPALVTYLSYENTVIPGNKLDELNDYTPEKAIAVPPQARASAIVRETLAKVIKGVVADRILQERVEVERVDLYYRPVYAFQFRWLSKEKEAVLEYNGLTGEIQTDGKTFQQYMGKMMEPEFLFDVGADTVELLVPGGGIAVKLARKGIDAARSHTGGE